MVDFKLNPTFPKLDIPEFETEAKKKSWDPRLYSPMVHNERIIRFADTLKPGTLDYDDFWDEMDYYCFNGYKPKGMPRISGRHFYYLNFTKIMLLPPGKKTKSLLNPLYRDLDHWLFLEYEAAEAGGYGLIISKPRQVGLSEFGVVNVNYNMKFYQHAEASIAAGKDDKVQEFKQKLTKSLHNTHVAYKSKIETNNDELMEIYYNDVENKQKTPAGIQTKARFKTMFADTGAFEGINNCKIAIFEEAGLFENIGMSFKATAPSFRSGAIQFGVPLVYGTGGEIDKGAKGYKEMWDNAEAYNLKRLFVPAYIFFPGDGIPDEETKKTISFFDHRTGVTNRAAAKKYIVEERQKASRSKDTYIKHIQTYPLIPSEVFLKTKGGVLNLAALNFQLKEISEGKSFFPVLKGRLEWKDTDDVTRLLQRAKNTKERTKIRMKHNVQVKFVEDEDNGVCFIQGNPINQNVNHLSYRPDIGACDSYDEEVDEAKKENGEVSSGCIMAYRCFSGPTREFNYPVGVLIERGDGSFDDDVFYENAVKFAVYFDIEVLFEYTKFHIMRYFYDVDAHKYVKAKPISDELGTKSHGNTDGVKMTQIIKTVGTKLLKSEVKENIQKCFITEIILDLIKFGDGNTDIAMTYMLCLIHRMDIFEEITDGIEFDSSSIQQNTGSISYYVDLNGNLKMNGNTSPDKIPTFNPERDLSDYEYKQWEEEKKQRNVEIVIRKKQYEDQAKELGVDQSILELIMNERNRNQ